MYFTWEIDVWLHNFFFFFFFWGGGGGVWEYGNDTGPETIIPMKS